MLGAGLGAGGTWAATRNCEAPGVSQSLALLCGAISQRAVKAGARSNIRYEEGRRRTIQPLRATSCPGPLTAVPLRLRTPASLRPQDLKARVFTGSEASRAMREIRSRDPAFDMNRFVQSVKLDAPHVVKAFLKHDLDTLALHCGPELLERFAGIFKHFSEQVGRRAEGQRSGQGVLVQSLRLEQSV